MPEYIHGYSKKEQQRLLDQASFFEDMIYLGVDMSQVTHLLEVGSGVGGQTRIILKRWPHLKITCVDLSKVQLAVAQELLSKEVESGQVELIHARGDKLSILGDRKFDGAFLCWFLEHVQSPLDVLKEVKKYLKSGSMFWSTEPNNSSLFVDPYSGALLKYFFEFNDYQWSNNGHPFIGLQMGNYLTLADYSAIELDHRPIYADMRTPELRKAYFNFMIKTFRSAEKFLLEAKRIDQALLDEMNRDIENFLKDPNSIFMFQWVRTLAKA